MWSFEVDRPAVVVGSRQDPSSILDLGRCAARGVEVVRRRSGGGAVLIEPGAMLWVDVVVPVSHPAWTDDVHEAMLWLGQRWIDALGRAGAGHDATHLELHRGPMRRSPWADLVCFEGVGPGEVLANGRKLVGISQRRTRSWARFQCAVHRRYDPEALPVLLRRPWPSGDRAAIASLDGEADPAAVLGRLVDTLG